MTEKEIKEFEKRFYSRWSKSIDFTEMFKLKKMLEANNIPFDFYEYMGGYALSYPQKTNFICDVILHIGSYGKDEGLLEIMGLLTPWEKYHHGDSVIGWLTAENVFKRIKKDWEEKQK